MKILALPRRFVRHEWGGTETVVLETGRRLRARGHDLRIWTPAVFSDVEHEILEGVPVRRFPYSYPVLGLSREGRLHMDKKGGNLFSFAMMRALGREPGLDLLHLHTMKRLGGIARREARRRGIPYVVTLHGGWLDMPACEHEELVSPLKHTLEWGKVLGLWVGSNRVLEDADAILCVGRRETEQVRERHPGKRVLHLPNGVDTARFARGSGERFRRARGLPRAARVILVMGRIDPQKNQLGAVTALARVVREEPAAHLVLAGPVTNPAYLEKLQRRVAELGLVEHVTLIEGLPPLSQELVDAFHAADCFLLPSIHEPFGIVILEAWAAGRPVAAARVGGVPSFVEDGRNGLLFPPGDEAAMAGAVLRLLREPTLAAALARAGQERAREQYDWERVTDLLLEVYEEVRGAHPLRA